MIDENGLQIGSQKLTTRLDAHNSGCIIIPTILLCETDASDAETRHWCHAQMEASTMY
jgi:hypothetical protein